MTNADAVQTLNEIRSILDIIWYRKHSWPAH